MQLAVWRLILETRVMMETETAYPIRWMDDEKKKVYSYLHFELH